MTEGRTPIDVMDAVTRSRGKEAINPFKIDGASEMRTDGAFSDEDPSYPAWAEPEPKMSPSPLVPPSVSSLGPTLEQPAAGGQPGFQATLLVLDGQAQYRGRAVELDAQAQNAIAIIVLREARRQDDNLMAELQAPARRPAKTPSEPKPATAKRRGRPKGSKNRIKVVPDASGLDAGEAPVG